jgi:hypothetical protein
LFSNGSCTLVKWHYQECLVSCLHTIKERLFLEVARKLGKKVYVGAAKRSIMGCLDLEPELAALLTTNHLEANIHTVSHCSPPIIWKLTYTG